MLVEELVRKIEEQRKEIENRSQNIMQIQRNFESLSLIAKKEKEENLENRKKLGILTEENNLLREENRVLVKR